MWFVKHRQELDDTRPGSNTFCMLFLFKLATSRQVGFTTLASIQTLSGDCRYSRLPNQRHSGG